MKLPKKETDFIKPQGVARIATVNRDGLAHNVPVCPLWDRGSVYVASETKATKMKNIEANPQATIVFDVYHVSWKSLRGVMLQCDVQIVGEKDFKKLRRKFYRKYPRYEKVSPIESADSVIIELIPKKKFSWGF